MGNPLYRALLIRNLSMNGSFHSHGGTPSSLDDFIENTIHKWMMTQVIPISGNLHVTFRTMFTGMLLGLGHVLFFVGLLYSGMCFFEHAFRTLASASSEATHLDFFALRKNFGKKEK